MPDLYQHEGLPYAGRAAFVSSCCGVVRAGLSRDERVIVLALADKLVDVRDDLGRLTGDVTLVATDEHSRNPSRVLTMLTSFQAGGNGRHAIGVNETVYLGRQPAAHLEAQMSDFAMNEPALRRWPLSVVCLYDTSALDEATLSAMRQCHAVIRGQEENPDYQPKLMVSMYATPLEAPPASAVRLEVGALELVGMRTFVRTMSAGFGVSPDRVEDLVLAANEIVTNSVRHGSGHARVAMWFADGSAVCEVADGGQIRDPLVGRFAPGASATSGRGLWLANHLCDLVQLRSSSAGTVVRMHVDS